MNGRLIFRRARLNGWELFVYFQTKTGDYVGLYINRKGVDINYYSYFESPINFTGLENVIDKLVEVS